MEIKIIIIINIIVKIIEIINVKCNNNNKNKSKNKDYNEDLINDLLVNNNSVYDINKNKYNLSNKHFKYINYKVLYIEKEKNLLQSF